MSLTHWIVFLFFMEIYMKKILAGLIIGCVAFTSSVSAQTLNTKEVVITTSFPVGSGPDTVLRKLGPDLAKIWGTPVIVVNKPGASGSTAYNECNKAENNRNRISLCYTEAGTFWAHPLIFGNNELTQNLKPLLPSHYADLVLVTSNNINTVEDLRAAMIKKPLYGSWTIGSQGQIASEQIARFLGVNAEHIAYKDYNQWMIDVSTGSLPYSFATLGSSFPFVQGGKLKYFGLAQDARDPAYPNVPTLSEVFGPKLQFVQLGATATFYVKRDMTADNQKIILDGLRKATQTEDYKKFLETRVYRQWTWNDKETQARLEADHKNYLKLVKQFKIDIKN